MERKLDATSAETVADLSAGAPQASVSRFSTTSIPEEGRFVPGTLLGGRYRIIGLLGEGGMGEVYRATDLTLGQSVALKFLPPAAAGNERLLERFHGEVRVARQVSHPNVCRVYDIGESEGLPFISMEYVDGEDLSTLLQRIGRLPCDKALDTARKICAGLAAAHSRGVIHRDLKPQNVMMNRRGEILIMDFGLAAIADHLEGLEARNGTPGYMSPEQLRGAEVTARSDIYALGLVLYELFTGKRPYEAKSVPQLIDLQEHAQLSSMSAIAADVDPAVERIIRRCLDPDPSKRPSSALAVSAALPGGDPLAAALAAGETPSPEMVASAGHTAGLARRYSLPLLAVILVCLATAPFIKEYRAAIYSTTLDYPPDVLRQKARDLAAAFGYSDRPADSAVWLRHRLKLLEYMNSRPESKQWQPWLNSEAPISAHYRESPKPLAAMPEGYLTATNPAPIDPGMVELELDGQGRLRGFTAVPYLSGHDPATPITPSAVFSAAQLDFSRFTEVPPKTVPRSATDELHAWKGPHPVIPNTELMVEIGSWRGRLTHAKVIWPWMKEDGSDAGVSGAAKIRGIASLAFLLSGVVFAGLMARRNWKLGRVDRRGALRIAIVQFAVNFVVWIGRVHAVPNDSMVTFFFNAAAQLMLPASLLWLLYLALEPALRSRWPHSIVTWNRLLAGRWLDPQVGSHILIGAAVGLGMWTLAEINDARSLAKAGMSAGGYLFALEGTRQWFAAVMNQVSNGLQSGFLVFFLIFGLRTILRKDWVAALVGAFLFAVLLGDVIGSPEWMMRLTMYFLIYAALIAVLLRFGLIVAITAIFFLNTLNEVILGSDWRAWYTATGILYMTLLLAIALFAFSRSLGDRTLIGGDEIKVL